MKSKPTISHDEAVIRELRDNPEFAVEYLKAVLEDADDPEALSVARRRVTEAQRPR